MRKHIQELLDLALTKDSEESPNLSTKAFTLLSTPNEMIFKSLFEDNIFFSAVEKVLGGDSIDIIIVNRLAVITQTCCINYPENIRQCNFIPRFLQFCRYRSVFEMFKAFLTTEDKKEVQAFLQEEGFPGKLLEHIKNTEEPLENNPDSPSVQNLVQLFRLIPLIKGCEVLAPSVTDENAIAILSHKFTNDIQEVLNKQWEAIASIVTDKNVKNIEGLSDSYLEILGNPELPLFTPQVESIIKIIGQVITYDNEYAQKLVDWEIGKKLANIIDRFPRHTLAHLTITNFALTALDVPNFPDLVDAVLKPLYAAAAKSFQDDKPAEFRGFGFNFHTSVLKKMKEKNLQPVPLEFCFNPETIQKIEKLTKVVDNSYGGELPQPQNEEADELGNLTPEQLMALLRFITGGRR